MRMYRKMAFVGACFSALNGFFEFLAFLRVAPYLCAFLLLLLSLGLCVWVSYRISLASVTSKPRKPQH